MKKFTLRQALDACGGRYSGDENLLDMPLDGVVIDSRGNLNGCLFVPICGERFDGHDFIDAAFGGGARCCLSERPVQGRPHILTDCTLDAFQAIAAAYRGLFDIPVIGITGSVGKTSTKEMIASVLAQRMHVLKTQGNLNNQTGVPLTLLRLEDSHNVAVIEMGTNHFGEIGAVAKITRPDYCVLTNIGDAHIENFGDRQGTLRAKSEMLDHIAPGGAVFVNGDDPLLCTLKDARDNVVTFGISRKNDIHVEEIRQTGLQGTDLTANAYGKLLRLHVPAPGEYMVRNALAGVAAGMALGMDIGSIAAGVAAYAPVGGRMDIRQVDGLTILNDVYNANPQSVAAALGVLRLATGRRVAILGDMRELGDGAQAYHSDTGRMAADAADLVIGVGQLAKDICEGAAGCGCTTEHFATQEDMIAALPGLLARGDTVLVKASRGMKLEDTVQFLTERADWF